MKEINTIFDENNTNVEKKKDAISINWPAQLNFIIIFFFWTNTKNFWDQNVKNIYKNSFVDPSFHGQI